MRSFQVRGCKGSRADSENSPLPLMLWYHSTWVKQRQVQWRILSGVPGLVVYILYVRQSVCYQISIFHFCVVGYYLPTCVLSCLRSRNSSTGCSAVS